ncbi:Proteasome subunit beta type-6 [Coemansia thaxteri]|uniref:Proteasome subunit beta n=1 Tax=Coemansia thaxteri TaxID=2663907 RepID=A0A9W8BP99_9FUNG|nr:Proteasome subunit beta type-6 [Coemansia thaxteri]KAJ2008623.1 Proteasome subunit beta type-6 [Coemansia thaxteri]KAJ2472353.1 Proteasome subunit beta type-6 [Coemansia sp. RSA 2322]KAJ2488130.1 Proteasome subunit beta type-6 [Coemansia sp. RSA 2320]
MLSSITQAPVEAHSHNRWEPYVDNGGTSLAIAGADFVIIAADTRQSDGYSINTRYDPKAFELSNKTVIATTGYAADAKRLVEVMEQKAQSYFHKHERVMSTPAMAQLLSNTLYYKRFFPYYVFPILAGLDSQGKGAVFTYDPVGNMERTVYVACGSASALVQPFLDNQVGFANQRAADPNRLLDRETARKIAIDAFTGATERDIYTGDWLEIFTIDQTGVHREKRELKRD